MAREFIALSENDTRELRKELKLPIFKSLRYMRKKGAGEWEEFEVTDYRIVDTYQPSGTHSFLVTLKTGEEVRVLQDFFVDMQKSSFVEDMKNQSGE